MIRRPKTYLRIEMWTCPRADTPHIAFICWQLQLTSDQNEKKKLLIDWKSIDWVIFQLKWISSNEVTDFIYGIKCILSHSASGDRLHTRTHRAVHIRRHRVVHVNDADTDDCTQKFRNKIDRFAQKDETKRTEIKIKTCKLNTKNCTERRQKTVKWERSMERSANQPAQSYAARVTKHTNCFKFTPSENFIRNSHRSFLSESDLQYLCCVLLQHSDFCLLLFCLKHKRAEHCVPPDYKCIYLHIRRIIFRCAALWWLGN